MRPTPIEDDGWITAYQTLPQAPDDDGPYNIVVSSIARAYHVTLDDVQSGYKWRPLPEVRAKASRVLAAMGLSLSRIAPIVGMTDHSSVVYWVSGKGKDRYRAEEGSIT
jgi:chromosomal replication initiation ATPase DnaA